MSFWSRFFGSPNQHDVPEPASPEEIIARAKRLAAAASRSRTPQAFLRFYDECFRYYPARGNDGDLRRWLLPGVSLLGSSGSGGWTAQTIDFDFEGIRYAVATDYRYAYSGDRRHGTPAVLSGSRLVLELMFTVFEGEHADTCRFGEVTGYLAGDEFNGLKRLAAAGLAHHASMLKASETESTARKANEARSKFGL